MMERVRSRMRRWLLAAWTRRGSRPSEDTGFTLVEILVVITILGIFLIALWGPTLDAACLSDDEATSVGVHLPSIRRKLFLTSSILAAIGVVLAGPIAFVGLIAPHAARLLLSGSHRALAIATAILGALLLVCADDIRQLIDLGSGRLPIGIVTSVCGGFVFLLLLLRGRGRV